jgi:signal transduction histidine kinase
LLPTLVVALASTQVNSSLSISGILLSLVALPGAYFYVVYRRQLGGLEFRANRLISAYLFLVLLTLLGLIIIPLLAAFLPGLDEGAFTVLATALVAAIAGIFGFPAFQAFVESRLLRIPRPPQYVLESFAGRISTSFSHSHLAGIVTEEVLPSMLVRQSALLDFEGRAARGRVLYLQGVTRSDLPAAKDLRTLAVGEAWVRRAGENSSSSWPGWVQAALPLTTGGEPRGLWLLGRKDPDDFYSQAELNLLGSLADQMSIALANISQAQSLRALHQADVERQEVERVHLARELHDDVLHRISDLGNQVDDAEYAEGFGKQLEGLVGQVRNLINGLRPPLLDQGLYFALQNLADDLAQKTLEKTTIVFDLPRSEVRFNPMVEQHLYRIIQHAGGNAIQHAQAKQISFHGHIAEDGVDLVVEDDGRGFQSINPTGLGELLATRHFGLAGMHERAAMIDARLDVHSSPGNGTRLRLTWNQVGQKRD